jgi:hypothetical protein
MSFKYIAFEGALHQEIVLFPSTRDHAQFAKQMGIARREILGAGFVSMNPDNPPSCWGQSASLSIPARPVDDTRLLRRMSGYDE